MEKLYDYVVVGSGFGGSVASLRLPAIGDVSNFHRNPIKFLKVIFDLKWSSNLVIFLVMQHIDYAMQMAWKPGIFGGCPMAEFTLSKIPEKKENSKKKITDQLSETA